VIRRREFDLSVKKQLKYTEILYKVDNRLVGSLWIRISEEDILGRIVVGVRYRPPDQAKEVDEISLQPEEASWSQILTFMGDYNIKRGKGV